MGGRSSLSKNCKQFNAKEGLRHENILDSKCGEYLHMQEWNKNDFQVSGCMEMILIGATRGKVQQIEIKMLSHACHIFWEN